MNLIYFWQSIKSQKTVIGIFIMVFFVLGAGLTLVQPLKYSSSLRLLVVQDASNVAGDPYAMARSNEYLSDVLSKVTYSTSFYNRAVSAGFNIDRAYFGNTNKKISKNWNKTIEVKKINNTGIISITAYHSNREQAEKIARAVGYVLITQNSNYHGLGNKVSLKLLDEPITSTWPVKPNLLLNTVLSLFLGLVFGVAYVYLTAENKSATAFISPFATSAPAEEAPSAILPAEDLSALEDTYRFIPEEPLTPFLAQDEVKNDDWLNDWR